MRIIIIEDEVLARQRIESLIKKNYPHYLVVGYAQSNAEFAALLDSGLDYDLVLCDIHLADGSSFETLKNHEIHRPIIFITAYDEYALESFNHLCLDYLLKPLDEKRLISAFEKIERMNESAPVPTLDTSALEHLIDGYTKKSYKKRFLTKMGTKFKFVATQDVAYFFSQDGITYLAERGTSNKYIVDYNLNDLIDSLLDPDQFYRINRSVIVNLECLVEMRPYTNGRLSLALNSSIQDGGLVVARERVSDFKNWINQ